MICQNCGNVFFEGIFCPECGTKYDSSESNNTITLYEDNSDKPDKFIEQELELSKAKAEQDRLAAERADKEAELLRQQNENLRMQKELEDKKNREEAHIASIFN